MASKQAQFEALVRATSGDLFRFAWWLCHNRALAEDLVQETYLRAWRSLDDLRETSAAKAWLITILRREHARLYERKALPVDSLDEPSTALPELETTVRAPEHESEDAIVRRAMSRLDPKYREPLLLQVLGGMSCEEIAGELGITAQAVMTQLFRARQKLKLALTDKSAGGQHELA